MKYRNKRTGAVIDTLVNIRGEDWEEIPIAPPVRHKKPEPITVPETGPVADKPKKTRRRRAAKS